jgi:hypothetical protein
MAKANTAGVLSSTEVNYLIYRYLQESGEPLQHTIEWHDALIVHAC